MNEWVESPILTGQCDAKVPLNAHPPALLADPLASPEGGSGQDAALRANLKMKRGGAPPDGSLAALLGPSPVQRSTGRAGSGK